MGFSASNGTAGFRYYFSILCGIGRGPIDELREIRMGGKLGWQGNATSTDAYHPINQPNLFGGDTKEGGIDGAFQLMNGEPTQEAPLVLKTTLLDPAGVPATGFRRMATLFFDGQIAALNPYPKTWSFRVRRAKKGWEGDVFRPDLAIIELLGQTTLPPEDSRPTRHDGNQNAMVPLVNKAWGTFPTVLPIESINSVYVVDGAGETGTNTAIPFEAERISETSFRIYVPCYVYQQELRINYTPGGGGPHVGTGNFTPDQVDDHKAYVQIVEGGTATVTAIEANHTYTGPWELAVNEPGNVKVAVPARYQQQNIIFTYTLSTGGTFNQSFQAARLQHPAIVPLAYNEGETFVRLRGANVFYWDVEDYDEWLMHVEDIYSEGQERNFIYDWKAFYVQLFLTPDPVIKAMNPAHIIYECYTNTEWGRSFPREVIDTESFEVAAQTLFDEGFGLCMKWSRRDGIKTFIQNVLDHIGAVIYMDPETAQLNLKLIRGDYDKGTLKLWTTSNGILEIKEAKTNGGGSIINEVVVTYLDPVFNEKRWVGEQNLASLQATRGAVNSMKKEYTGLPVPALARRVALRDLRAQSQGIRRFSLRMDRRAWTLRPGDVFRVQDEPRGIPDMVVRVVTSKDGTLQSGAIEIEAVQDVFSFPARSFTGEQPPAWMPADFTPCIGEHEVFEVPYFILARTLKPADFAYLNEGSAYIGSVAEKGQPKNSDYLLAVRDSAPTPDDVPLPADQLYCGYRP